MPLSTTEGTFRNLDTYLLTTEHFLGITKGNGKVGYWAITGLQAHVDFLADTLTACTASAKQVQQFFTRHPAFPAAWGTTPLEAMQNLDRKLEALYGFERGGQGKRYRQRLTVLSPDGQEVTEVEVRWDHVVEDLWGAYTKEGAAYFYDIAETSASPQRYSALNAVKNLRLPAHIVAVLTAE